MGPEEIGLHELGHSAFNLADEYEYWRGCEEDPPGDQDDHPIDTEPERENVTIDPSPDSLKWGDLVLRGTPLPTTRNPDCTHCDTQLNPVGADVVGAFEGAHYHHCRAYRPIFDCKMRTLGRPFCPVCQRVIERLLKPDVAYATPYAIASAHFPGIYLRMDATGVKTAPGGQVNCATEIGPWEQFFLRGPRTDGTYTIESKHFTRWLRMDGTGVTEPTGSGGGTVNCQGSIGRLTLLRIVPNVDGTVSFGSVAFPNVFLRMDGQGVTPPAGIGGVVNCQGTIAPWEKFRLMPLPR